MPYTKEKTIQERLDCLNRFVYFEIGPLFHSLYRHVKKRTNFKTNKFLQAIQSYLYCFNSRNIVEKSFASYSWME